jgi:hypothetical protein
MLLEIVFLKAVWEHNRRLWWFSFPFHFGMYLLIAGAVVLKIAVLGSLTSIAIATAPALERLVTVLATLGYGLGTIGAMGLLGKRLVERTSGLHPPATLNLSSSRSSSRGRHAGHGSCPAAMAADAGGDRRPGGGPRHGGRPPRRDAPVPATTVHPMMHFVAKYFTYHGRAGTTSR